VPKGERGRGTGNTYPVLAILGVGGRVLEHRILSSRLAIAVVHT